MIVDGIIISLGIIVVIAVAVVIYVLEDILHVLKEIRRYLHASRSRS
jgi:hypothetical protein